MRGETIHKGENNLIARRASPGPVEKPPRREREREGERRIRRNQSQEGRQRMMDEFWNQDMSLVRDIDATNYPSQLPHCSLVSGTEVKPLVYDCKKEKNLNRGLVKADYVVTLSLPGNRSTIELEPGYEYAIQLNTTFPHGTILAIYAEEPFKVSRPADMPREEGKEDPRPPDRSSGMGLRYTTGESTQITEGSHKFFCFRSSTSNWPGRRRMDRDTDEENYPSRDDEENYPYGNDVIFIKVKKKTKVHFVSELEPSF